MKNIHPIYTRILKSDRKLTKKVSGRIYWPFQIQGITKKDYRIVDAHIVEKRIVIVIRRLYNDLGKIKYE